MFFMTRFHAPKWSLTPQEEKVATLCSGPWLFNPVDQYRHQLDLKKHVSTIETNLHQLRGLYSSKTENINTLSDKINAVVTDCLNSSSQTGHQSVLNIQKMQNALLQLKTVLKDKKDDKIMSSFYILTNFIVATAGVLLVLFLGATAVLAAPLWVPFFATVVAMMSACLVASAAYSMYVDGRSLFDKQLKDIEDGVNFLSSYDDKMPLPLDSVGQAQNRKPKDNFVLTNAGLFESEPIKLDPLDLTSLTPSLGA